MNPSAPASSDAPRTPGHQAIEVIALFPELLGVGGVQEVGRLTAAAVTEIVSDRGSKAKCLSLNDEPGPHAIDVAGRNVSLHGFGRSKVRFVFSGLGFSRRVKKHTHPIVIAAHPHLAIPAALMQRVSPRLGVIVLAHGIEVWTPLSLLRRKALRRARIVLAPSQYTAERLSKIQGVASEKVRVLPWPLNPEFQGLAADGHRLPLPHEFPIGRVLLSVGRWVASERYKGLDDLIRVITHLRPNYPDLHLVAVGGGDDLPRLSNLAKSFGIADRVHFFSGLSRPQIAACYSHADVFALPSTGEGFGLVFLEAMAFGKPVVAAAAGGAVDLIHDRVNGILVPPQNFQMLSDALATLLSDDSLRARMGQAGAKLVLEKYCFDAFRRALECTIDECASQPGIVIS